MILLGHDPWHGTPYHPDNPNGDIRQLVYGFGHSRIVYLILEPQKRVVVERALWLEALG